MSHYTLFSDGLWCSLQDPCILPSSRSSDRTRNSELPDGRNSLERNKSGSPSSKANRFLSSLNQRKLFSKLFSSVTPQFSSQTLPQNSSHNPSTSHFRTRLYPSLSDDNLESVDLTRARVSPEHPSTPPICSRKSSLTSDASYKDSKKGNIQKASSFDFLPAFLSLFLYGDNTGGDKCPKTNNCETDHRKEKDKSHSSCNGNEISSNGHKNKPKSAPIPAPRLSLAKKDFRVSGPLYANREALATTGRSISLGENASFPLSEETNSLKIVENGLPIPQPFIRSASSPSVVSHSKGRFPLPSRLSTSEGGSCISCITVVDEVATPLCLVQPVPKPRKKLPLFEGQTETSCQSCASVESSTSPTITEMSEVCIYALHKLIKVYSVQTYIMQSNSNEWYKIENIPVRC